MRLLSVGVSHRGLVRVNNEDSGFCGSQLALVADGVGGSAAGEVASATATWAMTTTAAALLAESPTAVLTAGVRAAQLAVRAGVRARPARLGMATTLTALLGNGETFALAHIGDSRGYVWRAGELTRVTQDDTFVAEQIERGQMSEDEARTHPWRNVVLRSVNGDVDMPAAVRPLGLQVGDRVLLASDGVTDLIAEDRIAEILTGANDIEVVKSLRDAALANGGRDNITAVLATVVDGDPVGPEGHLLGAAADPRNLADLPAVRSSRTA